MTARSAVGSDRRLPNVAKLGRRRLDKPARHAFHRLSRLSRRRAYLHSFCIASFGERLHRRLRICILARDQVRSWPIALAAFALALAASSWQMLAGNIWSLAGVTPIAVYLLAGHIKPPKPSSAASLRGLQAIRCKQALASQPATR